MANSEQNNTQKMDTGTDKTCHGQWMSHEYEPGLVSVIIPTYNRAKFLVEAMKSVFAQTYRPIELIVVDDGSTDDTRDIVQHWQNKLSCRNEMKIRYIHQSNKGANFARNLGLRRSQGEFILPHDSDDILDRRRIQLQVERLAGEAADMCSGSFTSFPVGTLKYRCPQFSGDVMLDFLKGRVHGGTLCWLIRRNLINAIEGYDENLICNQDFDLTFRLLAMYPRVVFEPEALTFFHMHNGARVSFQKSTKEGIESILQMHKNRVNTLKNSFNDQRYLDAENQQILGAAISASAFGLYGVSQEFKNLSKQLDSHAFPGRTWVRRAFFKVCGVEGCAFAMRFLKKLNKL